MSSKAPEPSLSRFPRIPLIWILPFVALGVAVWMLQAEWRNHGKEITIRFADASGLEPGQTKVEYKGVIVGRVKEAVLAPDLRGVIVHVQLARDAEAIARKGAQFWIVEPEIGFGGISGLETLLNGSRIGVRPGTGAPATEFEGLEDAPAAEHSENGRAFLLIAERLASLRDHAPVFYRDIKVGEMEAARLTADATHVSIRIRVEQAYAGLVRTNTRFWNAGGSPLQISLFGGGAPRKSLQSVITGAIEFATPDEPAEVAPEGTLFELYKDSEKEWLKWAPQIPIDAPDSRFDPAPRARDVTGVITR
jgi:paraquat-inducible protein B